MSARIDGSNWSALSISAISTGGTGGVITIGAANVQQSLGFAWVDQGVRTYQVGVAVGLNANLSAVASPTQQWSAVGTMGSGSITVTTRTATRVAGTFTFTMVPASGSTATGTRQVTNGTFDVQLQ
jgi:hypothetical protein